MKLSWRSLFMLGSLWACAPQSPTELPKKSEKFPSSMMEALLAGEPQEVIVLLQEEPGYEGEALSEKALRYRALGDQVRATLSPEYALEENDYESLPVMALTLFDAGALEALGALSVVAQIVENRPHEAFLTQSLALVGQPTVASSGKTGAGTTVAVLDTGADFTLPAFGSCTTPGASGCAVVVAQDFAPNDNLRDDSSRHGTNVSAIVLGVAPGAKIAALDVFRSDGLAYSSEILAALDWVIQHKETYNITAVNLSLGGGSATSACGSDIFATALANVRSAGIVPVVASGNNGFTNALSSPACAPAAVSVGAVYDAGMGPVGWSSCTDATTDADKVTCFSNSASFLTLLAPGALIKAAGLTMGGTSQAAPHVAGAVAVLKAAFPEKSPDQIVSLLQETGASVTDPRNGITKKRLNLAAATSDCVSAVSPSSLSVGPGGATQSVSITASEGCAWTASSSASFINILSAPSGVGSGVVTFSVSANAGAQRSATLFIAKRSVSVAQAAGLDAEGPSGSVSINHDDAFTGSASVTLTISASDATGVSQMCISEEESCASFIPFSSSKTLTLSGDSGTKTVYVWFKDFLGNASSSPAMDSIILDRTKPVDGTLAAVGSPGKVSLVWSGFSDALSGLAGYQVVSSSSALSSCASGTTIYTGAATSFDHTGVTNGQTYFYRICAIDAAGNLSIGKTASARPATEYKPPVGLVLINNGASFTGTPNAMISLSASDESGVVSFCVSTTSSCSVFSPFVATQSITLSGGSGVKAVNVWFQDSQGNASASPVSDSILLDVTRPLDGVVVGYRGPGQNRLFWSGFSDAHSGLASYQIVYTTGATSPSSCTSGVTLMRGNLTSFTHRGTMAGVRYNYRVCAIDAVGNLSAGKVVSVIAR